MVCAFKHYYLENYFGKTKQLFAHPHQIIENTLFPPPLNLSVKVKVPNDINLIPPPSPNLRIIWKCPPPRPLHPQTPSNPIAFIN